MEACLRWRCQRKANSPSIRVFSCVLIGGLFLLVSDVNSIPTPSQSAIAASLSTLRPESVTTTIIPQPTVYTEVDTGNGVYRRKEKGRKASHTYHMIEVDFTSVYLYSELSKAAAVCCEAFAMDSVRFFRSELKIPVIRSIICLRPESRRRIIWKR